MLNLRDYLQFPLNFFSQCNFPASTIYIYFLFIPSNIPCKIIGGRFCLLSSHIYPLQRACISWPQTGAWEACFDNVHDGLSNQPSPTDLTDHTDWLIGGGVGGGGFLILLIGVVVVLRRNAEAVERIIQSLQTLLNTITTFFTKTVNQHLLPYHQEPTREICQMRSK